MFSPRRVRLLMLTAIAVLIIFLLFTSRMQSESPKDERRIQDFFGKTVNGLEHQHGGQSQVVMSGKGSPVDTDIKDKDGDGTVDEDDEQLAKEMGQRLRAAEQKAKEQANAKAPLKPNPPSEVVGIGSSAGGQKKGKNRGSAVDTEEETQESDEEHEVEVTMNDILKKSPIVIFSKTYCPYSKRAKGILLDKYTIDPPPYVVELDEHPLGSQLQAKLLEMTKRRTVPNILVNGVSVGGGDEIAELDTRKTLIDKFKSMDVKRLTMKERFVTSAQES